MHLGCVPLNAGEYHLWSSIAFLFVGQNQPLVQRVRVKEGYTHKLLQNGSIEWPCGKKCCMTIHTRVSIYPGFWLAASIRLEVSFYHMVGNFTLPIRLGMVG